MSDRNDILPVHIGLIMDGNGRWARKRMLPRSAGHIAGAKAFRRIAIHCNKVGIKYLTVYAFSTENWKRPDDEINGIIKLLRDYLKEAHKHIKENIRTKFIGDLSVFDKDILDKIKEAEEASETATGMNLNIAINYGGRDEIKNAVRKIVGKQIPASEITEDTIKDHLYTDGQPEVDLIIRPSGEYRLSNFLVWQAAYAEYIFMNVLWPDFTPKDLDEALLEYAKRHRRFGGI